MNQSSNHVYMQSLAPVLLVLYRCVCVDLVFAFVDVQGVPGLYRGYGSTVLREVRLYLLLKTYLLNAVYAKVLILVKVRHVEIYFIGLS